MDTIRVCKAAGDQIIDIFWSAGSGISLFDELCCEANVEQKQHAYIVNISLDGDKRMTVCLLVPSGRIRQMRAWLAGTGYRHRDLLDMLYGKI